MASRRQEVRVCAFLQKQLDQREILLVHGEVQRAATVALFLQDKEGTDFMSTRCKRQNKITMTMCVTITHNSACVLFTFAFMSAPRSTMFSTSERKP